jgi:hypothetical protein
VVHLPVMHAIGFIRMQCDVGLLCMRTNLKPSVHETCDVRSHTACTSKHMGLAISNSNVASVADQQSGEGMEGNATAEGTSRV